MIENIKWLGHASFKITIGDTIYIDPWEIKEEEKADLILISHSHYDHCSIEDINKLKGLATTIVCSFDTAKNISGNIRTVKPGNEIRVKNTIIKALPAYNIDKNYHPKVNEWLGFLISTGGTKIYFSGDTDRIPEMKGLAPDIAILPIGGHYTMGVEEAVKAIEDINPKVVIPMHYGKIIGKETDAEKLKKLTKYKVEILNHEV